MADEPLLRVARIAAGEFVMGDEDGEADERPAHRAYVDEFAIGVYPVTNAEYARFVAETGHRSPAIGTLPLMVSSALEAEFRALAARFLWANGSPPDGREHHPVTLVGFDDVIAYCRWLSTKTNTPVRLPTEAEWERAARGGVEGRPYPWGETVDGSHANFLKASTAKAEASTAAVGSYPPNAFELYDMAGNVWEWVSDWYSPTYYARAQYLNPQGPDHGTLRIVRGGAWVNADARYLRCAYRHKVPPDTYSYSIGFRVAYSLK
jgi:formylglycine-generating enzyme required for sulfatase activity